MKLFSLIFALNTYDVFKEIFLLSLYMKAFRFFKIDWLIVSVLTPLLRAALGPFRGVKFLLVQEAGVYWENQIASTVY